MTFHPRNIAGSLHLICRRRTVESTVESSPTHYSLFFILKLAAPLFRSITCLCVTRLCLIAGDNNTSNINEGGPNHHSKLCVWELSALTMCVSQSPSKNSFRGELKQAVHDLKVSVGSHGCVFSRARTDPFKESLFRGLPTISISHSRA